MTGTPAAPPGPCRLLDLIRVHRRSYMRLRVLRRNDPFEAQFFNLLIEDKSGVGQSYVDFLCAIHRTIQQKMT